ncbi:MAG: hypothetical protein ACKVXR_04650 [Planctomycetota bacterium]
MRSFALEKALAIPVIVGAIAFFSIDGLPDLGPFHVRLRAAIRPLLYRTCTWTGSWGLYAPDVDKTNTRVSAEILFDDGTSVSWEQPDWPSFNGWQRFVRFKQMEYFDNVRLDANHGAWPGFARALAAEAEARSTSSGGSARVVRVDLIRAWADIPPPGPSGAPPGAYVNFANRYRFHVWTPH